jgi:polyisoprenoid-binding protein YceI
MSTKTLTIDTADSKVNFSTKKLGFLNVKGTIADLTGQINFNNGDLENSSFDVSISSVTVKTGIAKRDEHLKSKDFFFVKNHPKICFKSTSIKRSNDQYKAIGILKILETTKEIEISFDYRERTFFGKFSLNRLDYALGNKFPAFIVGKNVEISINCKTKV